MAHDNNNNFEKQLRAQILVASLPLITESLGLATDAVKALRAQLARQEARRDTLEPLHTQLQKLELKSAIEDHAEERKERAEERKERAEERKERAEEREERKAERAAAAAMREERAAERERNGHHVFAG